MYHYLVQTFFCWDSEYGVVDFFDEFMDENDYKKYVRCQKLKNIKKQITK